MSEVSRVLLGCLGALAVIFSTTATGTARASTVSRSGGLLFVIASQGERNLLSIDARRGDQGPRVEVRDAGSDLRVGAFCQPIDNAIEAPQPLRPEVPAEPTAASCNAEKLAGVVVLAGDEADVVRVALDGDVLAYVDGGPGDDAIHGSSRAHVLQGGGGADRIVIEENIGGVDIVEGGEGPDRIEVVAGAGAAIVRCGGGFDFVELDELADRPSDGCEGEAYPAPTAQTDPDEAPEPAGAPSEPVPPQLPDDERTATATVSAGSCVLKPRRKRGALTVRLRPGEVGRGDVSWAIYRDPAKTKLARTGSDPVIAGRRERLTSMSRHRYPKAWLTDPQPCPDH